MPDKQTLFQLARFATAFREARDRNANESDTVMYLVKFCEDVLGYDSLKGEISKEVQIKDRYCDVALKVDGAIAVLIEAKAASVKGLSEKHIEQAENYASRSGLTWVVLTNGIEWRLYHLTFNEGEGITHALAFEANLVDDLATDPDALWSKLSLLSHGAIKKGELDAFWAQKKVLSPESVVKVLFHEEVLREVRRLLRRDADGLLDLEDVFRAVRDVISQEALAEAGDLGITKKRKRRRRVQRMDASTGQTVTEEVEEEEEQPLSAVTGSPEPQAQSTPADKTLKPATAAALDPA